MPPKETIHESASANEQAESLERNLLTSKTVKRMQFPYRQSRQPALASMLLRLLSCPWTSQQPIMSSKRLLPLLWKPSQMENLHWAFTIWYTMLVSQRTSIPVITTLEAHAPTACNKAGILSVAKMLNLGWSSHSLSKHRARSHEHICFLMCDERLANTLQEWTLRCRCQSTLSCRGGIGAKRGVPV